MKLEIGKLYQCKDYNLLLYPDPETAADAAAVADVASVPTAATAAAGAVYWSKRFGKNVSYAEKNIPLLVLNNKEEYIEVLSGDKKGWIIYLDWLNFKEIV